MGKRPSHFLLVVWWFALGALALTACLGEDWKLGPVSVNYEHHGSIIQVEPGEEFSVELRANGLLPERAWRIKTVDTEVVELIAERHGTEARAPGDYQGGEGSSKPWGFIGGTGFDFVGGAEGDSKLAFELSVGGELIDEYEVTVAVVDDACEVDESMTGVVTPIRCERRPPTAGPVGLVYDDYGWGVWLEPGDEFTVELRANAFYPDIPWQVTQIDTAVVEQLWSVHDTDVQTSSEHSRWPPTIFPETRLGFVAEELGESRLVLEMLVGDDRLDIYELTVFVVGDACDVGPGPIFTPHACD